MLNPRTKPRPLLPPHHRLSRLPKIPLSHLPRYNRSMIRSFILGLCLTSTLLPLSVGAENVRTEINEGIPYQLEGMYVKGLRFLQNTQNAEGNWPGQYGDEPGVVGFALMAFLAHGDDANSGPYATNIRNCISYILSKQNPNNGYIGSTMYTHGFATLALAEAYGMVRDDRIALALKKAVNLILESQKTNPSGGWRYSPDARDSDVSVCGCMMMALFAAKNAGLSVPDDSLKAAQKFMDTCRSPNGAYGYTSPGEKVTLTAIGALVQSIGKQKNDDYKKSVDYLRKNITYRDDSYMFYFEYYMAQTLFHADESLWNDWNAKNIRLLHTTQRQDGSWETNNQQAYNTALALLSLAVNYRFLPIYEK